MINKVKSTVKKYNMLPEGARVVAAVSGGSDSMVMLDILCKIRDEYKFSLCVAHVNHCLRGESADRDEAFVKDYCEKNGIPFHLLRADVAKQAKEGGMSLEECGRKVRYDFFNSIDENAVIATAHNLSDKIETLFFNLSRGSSLRGLCSIPAVRDNIIRPLIECSKDEILEYCTENSIEYMTDETNSDVKYSRNRIRHRVIPEIKSINPSFEACALRCIDALGEDEAFLNSLACDLAEKSKRENGYDVDILSNASMSILRRAIIKIIENDIGITPEHRSLENIIGIFDGGTVQINGGVTVRVRKGVLDFPKCPDGLGDAFIETHTFNIDETNYLQLVSNKDLEYYLDCDKILGKIILRSREPGDKITLGARGCSKSLKKLFNELSIPPEKRDSIAVVADDNGLLILEGTGVDKRAAVTKETKRIMTVKIIRNNGV